MPGDGAIISATDKILYSHYTQRPKYVRMSKDEHHVESGSKLPHSKTRLRHILVSRAAALECGASAPLFFTPLMCTSIYDAVYR
jgi:hypothetical protein